MVSSKNSSFLTVRGSGTCVPSLKRRSCSVLIKTGHHYLLFDAGAGTIRRLLEADITIFDISFIFFSHFHPDHTGELVPFLFASKYPENNSRQDPLTIIAAKGFSDFYHGLRSVYGQWIELEPGIIHIVELDNHAHDMRKYTGFDVESLPVNHRDESIAYRLTCKDRTSIVYSGDTDYSENLISLAENADLLICESALPDKLKVDGHLTPSLAGRIASQANVGTLMLTHFYPECDQVDIEAECRITYSGPLILAKDLMKIKLDKLRR